MCFMMLREYCLWIWWMRGFKVEELKVEKENSFSTFYSSILKNL